ncbi:MAG: hypothetical protein NDJ89_17840 [Oligoflexia bacterium]|nr:hypothetical protein [Oligoflexia bacterium]
MKTPPPGNANSCWNTLAYSRVVTWGRELRNVSFYVIMNELEVLGVCFRDWNARRNRAGPRLEAKLPEQCEHLI